MQFRNSTSCGQYSRSNFTQNLKKFYPLSAPVTRTRTRARFFKLTRLLYDSVHRFKIISVYFTFAYPLLKSYPYPVITLYVFGYEKCTEYGFCTRNSGCGSTLKTQPNDAIRRRLVEFLVFNLAFGRHTH